MRVLILSTTTGYQLRSFGEAAERAGIDLLFGTDRCHQLDDPWRDAAIPVRFHQEDASLAAIVDASRVTPIDGIVAVGDRPVLLAARAAAALGVPGNPPSAAAVSVNKSLTRRALARAGLPVPWFFEVNADDEVGDDDRIRYPCVVKPLGLSGSRGVMRANTREELDAALRRLGALLARKEIRALRTGLDDTILIEGFIPGHEIAIEGVLANGGLQTLAIFDKPDPLDGPYFEETIYVTPSRLDFTQQRAIMKNVHRAATALGLTHGPVHAECRVGPNGLFILEVAARPIGGLCSKVLKFMKPDNGGSVSLEDVLLQQAIGRDVAGYRREARAAAVMMIPIPRRGTLKRVDGLENATAIEGVEEIRITAKTDQLLEQLPEAASYLGFIFSRGANADDAVKSLREAHSTLRFEIAEPVKLLEL